ncbi:MAG: hypothetical protein ABSG62_20180 [Terracidiphilus sp.]|jgi:hypothetical protein
MNPGAGKRWIPRIAFAAFFVAIGMLLSFGIFMFWVTAYPEDYDPKNIDYVLWTHGLNKNMNLDDAVGGMTHDTWSVRLVKGLSKEQLTTRFGNIRELKAARPYDRLCDSPDAVGQLGVHPNGKEVVFLRDSDWMAILENDRAVDLVLCKGY